MENKRKKGFQKGQTAWNKGKKTGARPLEVREKIRLNNAKYWLGKTPPPLSKEARKKISEKNSGKKRPWVKGWNKGKKHSMETRKKLSGANNKWWKGGVTPINLAIRTSLEYKLWRTAVFTRDNYTCIWCGERGDLNADHIKPFALFPELRFAIDNGRTLCVPCHKTTETYGRKTR